MFLNDSKNYGDNAGYLKLGIKNWRKLKFYKQLKKSVDIVHCVKQRLVER